MSLTPSVDWHMGSEIVNLINQIGMQIHILYHTTTNSPWATPLHFHFEITKNHKYTCNAVRHYICIHWYIHQKPIYQASMIIFEPH